MGKRSAEGIVQVCHVVEDLDDAIARWIENFGAGPFFVQRNLRVPIVYRGSPSHIDIDVALGQSGELQVELIKIASMIPSVYRDVFPNGGGGFHHVAMFVPDFQDRLAAYEREGCPIGATGEFNGSGFAYVDTRSKVGFFTELYEEGEGMRKFYANIAGAAIGWSGESPVRPFEDVLP